MAGAAAAYLPACLRKVRRIVVVAQGVVGSAVRGRMRGAFWSQKKEEGGEGEMQWCCLRV